MSEQRKKKLPFHYSELLDLEAFLSHIADKIEKYNIPIDSLRSYKITANDVLSFLKEFYEGIYKADNECKQIKNKYPEYSKMITDAQVLLGVISSAVFSMKMDMESDFNTYTSNIELCYKKFSRTLIKASKCCHELDKISCRISRNIIDELEKPKNEYGLKPAPVTFRQFLIEETEMPEIFLSTNPGKSLLRRLKRDTRIIEAKITKKSVERKRDFYFRSALKKVWADICVDYLDAPKLKLVENQNSAPSV